MPSHKFRIGQAVEFASRLRSGTGSSGTYKVIQLVPEQDGELQYRIKSSSEPHERVVRESELQLPGR